MPYSVKTRLYRKGTFSTFNQGEHKCGATNHTNFWYECSIFYDGFKVDERGFIYDQLEIGHIIRTTMSTSDKSCELMCFRIVKAVKEDHEKKGIPIKSMEVLVGPYGAPANFTIFMDF